MRAFSPHISRGYADQQNSQPVILERSVAMSRNAQGHSPCLSPPAMLDYT
jgi:hypothetical protein